MNYEAKCLSEYPRMLTVTVGQVRVATVQFIRFKIKPCNVVFFSANKASQNLRKTGSKYLALSKDLHIHFVN